MTSILDSFRLPAAGASPDIDAKLLPLLEKKLGVEHGQITNYTILKRCVDARKREVMLDYRLLLESASPLRGVPEAGAAEIELLKQVELPFPEKISLPQNPVVIGTGPAGIFAALALAQAGLKPLILDRGQPMAQRIQGQQEFLKTRVLDEENNLLIGEGGAGAFSDGKLYTGTKDKLGRFVLQTFVEAGADKSILYRARPHLGSDVLPGIGVALRRKIEALGGTFRFGCEVEEIIENNGRCAGVKLRSGERISAPAVLVAPGLGGRELIRRLAAKVDSTLKPFQIGCRIEHPQEWVDHCQYHGSRPEALESAEYHLVDHPGTGAMQVSSFCMCPGGRIVNASAWQRRSSTNGVSDQLRSGKFANSCLIATILPERSGSVKAAFALIEYLEQRLFIDGGGDYTLPAQDAAAFLAGKKLLSSPESSSECGVTPGRIDALIPDFLGTSLRFALRDFDRKMAGFIRYGKLVGVECCVSSPLRLTRDQDNQTTLPGLFASGEGIGAAGGIVSAACDGLRTALKMVEMAL